MEKFLPIGTVLMLKDSDKRLMIIGFLPIVNVDNKEITYDYSGCMFPEGVIDSNKSYVFNHEQIDKIYSYGLVDGEQKAFMEYLVENVNNDENNLEIFDIYNIANNINDFNGKDSNYE